MMLFSELPVILRQSMTVATFLCFISVVPLVITFRRRKQRGNLVLSVVLLAVSYYCLQAMSGVARLLAWSYVEERFLWGAEVTLALHALPLLLLFGAMVGLAVRLMVLALRYDEGKAPNPRFSALKVRLHDTFGLSLVATKAYYDGQEIDRDTVHLLYARCRECFSGETLFSCRTYESIDQIGRLIGVGLQVTGTLPEEETIKPVICAALSECMLNTFRHAWGNLVYAEVSEGDGTTITIRNNGKQPEGPIEERGGLKHLRSYAESLGITMTITGVPEFSLTLSIPKEVQHGL